MPPAAQKAKSDAALDRLKPQETALFLDFDGVVTAIVDDPDDIEVSPQAVRNIGDIYKASGFALAIVSGREIDRIDRFLSPLYLPVAGIHGAQRRTASGDVLVADYDIESLSKLTRRVRAFADSHEGLRAEEKPGSVALHYRNRPELAEECLDLAGELENKTEGLTSVRGKMVVEMKLANRTKADAIRDFMVEPPFLGRTPVFFGDDVTDEDGFAIVNELGGLSVKIGDGPTAARHRLPDVAAFHAWLDRTATRWSGKSSGGKGTAP